MSASEAGEVVSQGTVSLKTIVVFIGALIAFVVVLYSKEFSQCLYKIPTQAHKS